MFRYQLRTLLLIIAPAAMCLTIHRVYQRWYLQNYSVYSLWVLLGTQVQNGDTLEEVARHFRKAEKVDPNDPKTTLLWNQRNWTILPGDEIWSFQYSSRNGVNFQFRDGRVVNFQPSDYADVDALAKMNRDPVPPRWLRWGAWPYCLVMFVVGSCVLILIEKKP